MSIRSRIRAELETPPENRRFGSGWIAGTFALLTAIVALLLTLVLRHPSLLAVPALAMIREQSFFRPGVHVVLILAYGLSFLSLMLRRDRTLGLAAMTITL